MHLNKAITRDNEVSALQALDIATLHADERMIKRERKMSEAIQKEKTKRQMNRS